MWICMCHRRNLEQRWRHEMYYVLCIVFNMITVTQAFTEFTVLLTYPKC